MTKGQKLIRSLDKLSGAQKILLRAALAALAPRYLTRLGDELHERCNASIQTMIDAQAIRATLVGPEPMTPATD